jgi:Metal binding domain of Ada
MIVRMSIDFAECDRACLARDRSYDGRFYTAVHTTDIYCRPVCPVRPARSANVSFFPSATAAELAGFRLIAVNFFVKKARGLGAQKAVAKQSNADSVQIALGEKNPFCPFVTSNTVPASESKFESLERFARSGFPELIWLMVA